MSGTDYDDSNPAILYSSGWTAQMGTTSQQFMSTSHTTTIKGASATVKFQGSRVVLYLTVPQGSGEESITWTLDGANPGSNTRHRHDGTTYYQDNWYDSGPLTNGAHTLVVANAENAAPFVFDKVNIIGNLVSVQPPAPAPVPPKPTTTTTPPPTNQAQQQTQTQTEIQTVVSTQVQTVARTVAQTAGGSSSVNPSETGASSISSDGLSSAIAASPGISQSRSVSGSGSSAVLVSTQYVTTGADGATSTIHTVTQLSVSTSSPNSISAAQKSSFPITAVIGGVIGGIALAILGLIVLCLLRRRNASKFGKLQESGPDVEREVTLRRRPTDISPFRLDSGPARLVGGGADVSRTASNSSAASGNVLSEKAQLYNRSPSSPNHHPGTRRFPTVSTTASSPSLPTPLPQEPPSQQSTEVDTGAFHLHNPNLDTTSMILAYVPVNHLLQSPRDSRGAPPSYQSAATRARTRPESLPPLHPLGIIDSSNLSTSTLDYVTPVSATEQDDLPRVDPLASVSGLSAPLDGNEQLADMPWARGW